MASAAASQVLQGKGGEKVNLKTAISLSILSFNLHYYHFTLDDSTKLFKKVPALQTIIFFSHFHILFHPKQFSLASLLPIPPPTSLPFQFQPLQIPSQVVPSYFYQEITFSEWQVNVNTQRLYQLKFKYKKCSTLKNNFRKSTNKWHNIAIAG